MPLKYHKTEAPFGYKAFHNGKFLEVFAKSSYAASVEATKLFKAKKSWEVTVVLCEKHGKTVSHSTSEF